MNTHEPYTPDPVPPVSPDSEELLRELMPKLGLEAKAPGTRYRLRAWIRFLLPKVLIVGALAAALICAGVHLTGPAEFLDVQVEETPALTSVRFRVNRIPLLESVKADLDGQPVIVDQEGTGAYRVDVTKNGELTITARTSAARVTKQTLTVSSIDSEPPHVDRDEYVDGEMFIYFTDGDGSGVDWDSVTVTEADTGEPFPGTEVSAEDGCVRFPFPDMPVRIFLQDKTGNPLAVLMDPLPEEGSPA